MTTPANTLVRAKLIDSGFNCLWKIAISSERAQKNIWPKFQPTLVSWLAFHSSLRTNFSTDLLGNETKAWADKYVEMLGRFKASGYDVSGCPTLLKKADDLMDTVKKVALWVSVPVGLLFAFKVYKDFK